MSRLSAENGVIGSILLDPSCLPLVNLSPDDFENSFNRELFTTIKQMQAENEIIDSMTVRNRMLTEHEQSKVDRVIIGLMEITPTAANVEAYVGTVKSQSQSRKAKQVAFKIIDRMGGSKEVIAETIADLETLLQDSATDLVTTLEALTGFVNHRRQLEGGSSKMFVPTGLGLLDKLLGGGLMNSGFYILAGRPGMGKTSVALQIADFVAEKSGGVLFVSLEMSEKQITAKRLSRQSGVSATDLLMQPLDESETKRLNAAAAQLSKIPVTVNKKPRATVADIQAMAMRVKPRLLIIDYIGLIKPESRKSRYEDVSEISHELKAMAIRLNIPVLCLAQLNRENEQKGNKKPQLHHLRDSGDIEQDADCVLFIYRDDYYVKEVDKPNWESAPAEIIVAKNRYGQTGKVDYAWFGNTGRLIPTRRE